MTAVPSAPPRDGRQTRWDGHKEERRRQIIMAAIEIAQTNPPDAEIHVQEIAARAGLSRTVVYRHFADRADLDRAVQAEILEQVWALLLPQVTPEGTVVEITSRIVSTYVQWAVEHPSLHRLADHDTAPEPGPLQVGLDRLAEQISGLLLLVVPRIDAEVSDDFADLVDPLVYGIVGSAFSAVRRWISRPDRVLAPERIAALVTESIWFVIQGHAASFGFHLTREMRVEEIIDAVMGAGSLPS